MGRLYSGKAAQYYCMSSADMSVKVFRELESEDFRILQIIETAMSKREFVPVEQIQKYAKLPMDRIQFTLSKLNKLGLIYRLLRRAQAKLCRLRYPCDKCPCKSWSNRVFRSNFRCRQRSRRIRCFSPRRRTHRCQISQIGKNKFSANPKEAWVHSGALNLAFSIASCRGKGV